MQLLIILVLLISGSVWAGTLNPNLYWRTGATTGWVDLSAGISPITLSKLGDATGSCTATDNTTIDFLKNGRGKNIRLDLVGGASSTTFCRVIWQPTAKDFSTTGTFAIRWHTNNDNTVQLSSASFDITNDVGGNNGFRFNPLNDAPLIHLGWNYQLFQRDQSTVLGTGAWSSTMARTHLQWGIEPGASATIYIDEYTYGAYQAPKIMPIFVGAYSEQYTTGFSKLQALGVTGTLVVPTSKIGTGGRMTAAQVSEVYAAGWSVIHAGPDETEDWKVLSQATIEQRIRDAEAVMGANGWTRDLKHVFLPGTSLSTHRANSTVDAALTARGVRSAIGPWDLAITSSQHLNGQAIDPVLGWQSMPYRLHAFVVNNPESAADVAALVKTKIGAGSYLAVAIGKITGAPASGDIATADFNTYTESWRRTAALKVLPWGTFLRSTESARALP